MSYQVNLRPAAQKQLDKLVGRDYELVITAIFALGRNPRPPQVKKLANSGFWRIRIKQYRAVYLIDDKKRLVIVVRIVRRAEDTYKGL